jgi:hypothetical protein
MAKSSNRGGGTGTSDRGGVRTTMQTSFGRDVGKGSQGSMGAPFNAPRSGGDNGLPTKIYDGMGGPKAGPAASSRDVPPKVTGYKGR